jgi:hypothetical protein
MNRADTRKLYDNAYYHQNEDKLKVRRMKNYYKRNYGLMNDLLFEEFEENKKMYQYLKRNKHILNPEIIWGILERGN